MVRSKKPCTDYERENFVEEYRRSIYYPGNNRQTAVIGENQEGPQTLLPEAEASIQNHENENSASKLKVGITQKSLSDRSLRKARIDVIDESASDLIRMNPIVGMTEKRKRKPRSGFDYQQNEQWNANLNSTGLKSSRPIKQKQNSESIPTEKTAEKSVKKSNKQKKHDHGKSAPKEKVKVVKY